MPYVKRRKIGESTHARAAYKRFACFVLSYTFKYIIPGDKVKGKLMTRKLNI